ncbi:MAG: OmpA family protein [Bacteroidia bacterium]|nr:OmpA family protein [Bacteroidia bacterium]
MLFKEQCNIIFCCFFLLLPVFNGNGQDTLNLKFNNYKTLKLANRCYDDANYYPAIDLYKKLYAVDPENISVIIKLAECYVQIRDYLPAMKMYKETLDKDAQYYPLARYYYALMLKMNGKYEEALQAFSDFSKEYTGVDFYLYKNKAKDEIVNCQFAISALKMKNDSIYIENIEEINNDNSDFAPVIYGDNVLIFSSLPADHAINRDNDTLTFIRLYKSEINKQGAFNRPELLEGPFNTSEMHTANGCFFPDKKRFCFTRCRQSWDRRIICTVFISEYIDNILKEPEKLCEEINLPGYTATHPNIGVTEDKREILYFVSDRPGGIGGLDIWCSEISADNTCTPPVNLGNKINTQGDEATPFFDSKTQTLYFSSDGWNNIGGLDIFKSEMRKSKWSMAQNMGIPINSSVDDFYYILSGEPSKGFLVSNRSGGNSAIGETCCDDIYWFGTKPRMVHNALLDTETILAERDTVKITLDSMRDSLNKDILLMKKIENIKIEEVSEIENIEENVSYIINNIFFDFDKATLTAESLKELDNLVSVLGKKSEALVEISAHTDSKGSDSYNINLSQRRAESVVRCLISKGIKKERLIAKGYGETRPVAPNTHPDSRDNPGGRAMNRRVEFKLVGKVIMN